MRDPSLWGDSAAPFIPRLSPSTGEVPKFPRGPSLALALGVAHPSVPSPALPGVPGWAGGAQAVSEPLPQTHRSYRGVPSAEGRISPHSEKPSLGNGKYQQGLALGNGKNFFFFLAFFPFTVAVFFQVFSPRAPGAPGPGAAARRPFPFPFPFPIPIPIAIPAAPRDTLTPPGWPESPQGRCPTTAERERRLSGSFPALPCRLRWAPGIPRRKHRARGRSAAPPAPAEPSLPFGSATFQSKSGWERGGRGAWRGREGSFCSKSQEEEIHFLNSSPRWKPLLF